MAKRDPESYLQIHLPEGWPDDERVRWSRHKGARVEDGVCAVRELPAADEVAVVLPAARMAFARARLPHGPVAKLARLAPFAIEDAIAPSPESVRTALVRHLGDGEWLVAVLDRSWFDDALAALADEGAEPDRVIAESALVPYVPGAWSAVWHGAGGFVVIDDAEAIALDATVDARAPLALKLAADERRGRADAPQSVRVFTARGAEPPDLARWSDALHVPVAAAGPWRPESIDARAIAAVDLRAEGTDAMLREHGRLARLRPAALVAAIVLGVHGLLTVGDWLRLRFEAAGLRAAAEANYRTAFPDARTVVDPALQMARGVAGLRRAAGEPDPADALPLLARLAPALQAADVRPQALKYERGQIELELVLPAGASREALAARLRTPGLAVRVERVTSGAGGAVATVRIGAEGG
jgi:general secretion pathway protein L